MDIFKRIDRLLIQYLWLVDLNSLGRLRASFIKIFRLFYVAVREFLEGDLNLRAMGLVYTTILALVPLLAVSFSVLKAFGVYSQLEPILFNFLAPLGEKGYELTDRIMNFVGNIKVGVLGSVGLALLIYTVISLIKKIEDAFNFIWRIKNPRSFARRFSDYMSVLVIGPVLIFSAMGLTASIMSTSLMKSLAEIEPFGSLIYYASKLIPYVLVCVAFTFIYIFIPNTKVNFKSALVGGIFGGVLWETSGWAFASFVVSSTKYTAIYSGFAIMILFFIWLYISWLTLLIGAQISFYHQYPHLVIMKSDTIMLSNRLKEKLTLMIMYLISLHHYENKKPWRLNDLVAYLGIPVELVQNVIEILKRQSYIAETSDEPPAYLPLKDISTVKLKDFYKAIRNLDEVAFPIEQQFPSVEEIDRVLSEIDHAVDTALGEKTLKSLLTDKD
ncbi:MAG: YihY/virulence factor BrkB family protein [Nitrospirae bacterium]|nr:YihY/virulence factor BrkB family protein [Nitrospirota bacterium]